MMEDNADQMRNFIVLAEFFAEAKDLVTEEEVASPVLEQETPVVLIADLEDIVFRLRGFMESSGGEYALGVEMGMQRAADMIENLIRRHTEGNSVE